MGCYLRFVYTLACRLPLKPCQRSQSKGFNWYPRFLLFPVGMAACTIESIVKLTYTGELLVPVQSFQVGICSTSKGFQTLLTTCILFLYQLTAAASLAFEVPSNGFWFQEFAHAPKFPHRKWLVDSTIGGLSSTRTSNRSLHGTSDIRPFLIQAYSPVQHDQALALSIPQLQLRAASFPKS